MKQTLEYLLSSLVDEKDKVDISETDENGLTTFTITLAKDDMGKIIGKEGKVIRSIRNAMKIKAIKEGKRINITLNESAV